MEYSSKLANKIRTKLLLFIDKEIRTKPNNILYLNKTKNNNGSICQIKTKEELFSSTQKKLGTNRISNLNSSPELQFKACCKFRRQIKVNIESKFKQQKSNIEDSKNNETYSKNQKYFSDDNKRKASQIFLKKIVKHNRPNSKEYLKKLCKNLINRPTSNKYYFKSKISKKATVYSKSPKSKKIPKNIELKKEPNQSLNNIGSFRIILFALDD